MHADDPFMGTAPPEVPLARAPLIRVVAQVRFPTILSLNEPQPAALAGFQEAIRADYPVFRQEVGQEIRLSEGGSVMPGAAQRVWRFADQPGEWAIAAGASFVALDTCAYSGQASFLKRLENALRAAHDAFQPRLVDRLGLRYVNRVEGALCGDLRELVRPEMLGLRGSALADRIHLSMTETLLALPGGDGEQMRLRHGTLPPKATYDPATVPPSDSESWVFDIDAFRGDGLEFNVPILKEAMASLADKCYRMFRWIVTSKFLAELGAQS